MSEWGFRHIFFLIHIYLNNILCCIHKYIMCKYKLLFQYLPIFNGPAIFILSNFYNTYEDVYYFHEGAPTTGE